MFEVATSYNVFELFSVVFAGTFCGCALWDLMKKYINF